LTWNGQTLRIGNRVAGATVCAELM